MLKPNNPLVSSEYFPCIIAIMLSILARILFIMAYGVFGPDRLHNCLRLHDTGFVMSRLRLFVVHYSYCSAVIAFLALQCYPAVAFFVMLIVYRSKLIGNNHHRDQQRPLLNPHPSRDHS